MQVLKPFSPPPGIFPDDTTFAAEGRWEDCNNVRFHNGKAQVIGGWASQFTLANGTYGGVKKIFPFTRSGTVTIAYGTVRNGAGTVSLLVGTGLASPSDRTPVGISASTAAWSFDSWGDTLLACPHGGTLWQQTGTSTATEATEAPDRIDAGILVSDQRQVLAFAANEVGGTHNPMCVRVSNIEDYSSAGSWTPASTNNADEIILEGHGKIVGKAKIGPYIAVWTNAGLYLGTYAGNPGQSYRFEMVDGGCGLVGPDAVTVHDGRAYWMDMSLRIRTWAPGELPQIVPCPLANRILTSITKTATANVVACGNSRFDEIWFSYQTTGLGPASPSGTQNNWFVAFNLKDGTWFNGGAGRMAMVESGLIASLATASEFAAILSAIWSASSGAVYLSEVSASGTSANDLTPWIQSAVFSLDNGGRRVMIRSVRPDFEGQAGGTGNPDGDISLRLFVRSHPQSTATTKGPYQLTTATVKKDFRASGKLIQVKLSANAWSGDTESLNSPDGYFRLGKLLFDIEPMGER